MQPRLLPKPYLMTFTRTTHLALAPRTFALPPPALGTGDHASDDDDDGDDALPHTCVCAVITVSPSLSCLWRPISRPTTSSLFATTTMCPTLTRRTGSWRYAQDTHTRLHTHTCGRSPTQCPHHCNAACSNQILGNDAVGMATTTFTLNDLKTKFEKHEVCVNLALPCHAYTPCSPSIPHVYLTNPDASIADCRGAAVCRQPPGRLCVR